MKTLLIFLYTFGVTVGVVALDAYRLSPGVVITALAVAGLFIQALHDGRRAERRLVAIPVTRFPQSQAMHASRRSAPVDLAA